MSIKLVTEEIQRFLKSSDSEAICVMGKWGVGKTFAWNQYLKTAISENSVSLKRYAYVSLFGQNSLEELRYAIFESTVRLDQIESGPDLNTLRWSAGFLEKLVRKTSGILDYVPKVKNYAPLFARSFFLTVRNQIVCIDDLERVGDGLSTKDVLGLISFLKEQRKCKVVLLLNDERLNDQASKDFRDQLEKIVDVEMRFEPTPYEAAEIGADKETVFRDRFVQTCVSLGILNIRVIKKIERLLKRLEVLLAGHDKRVFEAALPSIVLFGWSVYQPKIAPPLDFIKDFNPYRHMLDESKKESEQDEAWRLTLSAINFTNFDEFDQVLLDSVQRGYFDSDAVEKSATEFDKRLLLQDQDNTFQAAWAKYHDSFSNNGDEVLDEMFKSFKSGVQSINPTNVDGTVGFFRKMGRDAQADEMISYYMSHRNEKRDFYDPGRSVFLQLKDPKLAKAFADKLSSYKDTRDPKDILIHIARSSGWNPEDIATLANLSPDDYYNLFKNTTGDDLRIIVSQALKFVRFGTSDLQMPIISSNAEEALKRIAKESEINRQRVLSYGVALQGEESSD